MMKILAIVLLGLSFQAEAGIVVYENMYSQHSLLIGEGMTNDEALMDALSAMPVGYEKDESNGPQVECTKVNPIITANHDFTCDVVSFSGNHYRIIQPIVQIIH